MQVTNRISQLLTIKYPIIQAGMVWASGWKLAAAVSNCGGLGLIGAGSMKPELLAEHIRQCQAATTQSFGVNIPLLRGDAAELVETVIQTGVKIVFTSAGHPGKFIDILKKNHCCVIHVVPTLKFAKKAESVGCDAVVGEGVEAGGHNGADEITTLCLIPELAAELSIPVIAAGGIATGSQILACLAMGAEGVQLGTRFAATLESSAHENYKKLVCEARTEDTILAFRKIGLVRMIRNDFALAAQTAELQGADENEQRELLGKKREMQGIFQGDMKEGQFEAGQSVGLIREILPVSEVFQRLLSEFDQALARIHAGLRGG
jgi:enoyl-[acyl-carrier protein] reductase II